MKNRWTAILGLLVAGFMAGCGRGATGFTEVAQVSFTNESQFTLEALFLHDQPLNYKDQTNLLEVPLQPGESLSEVIPSQPWYVTVYRRPNKDSDVLAYTSAKAWDVSVYRSIIYFDEQFRVQK